MPAAVWRVNDRATQIALRRARRVRRGVLTVGCVADPGQASPRVAFAIGRSAGGAVQRNRLRRRARAAITELVDDLSGKAWLVGVGSEGLDRDAAGFRADLNSAVEALQR